MLLGIEFPSGRLWSEQETCLSLITVVPWLIVRSIEHIACEVVAGRRLIERSTRWLVVDVLSWSIGMLNKHSPNGANHF